MNARAMFDMDRASSYSNQAQVIRVVSEHWTHENIYCPSCGAPRLCRLPNNQPVADFRCSRCTETYELKSKRGSFGTKVVDGAYTAMMDRLSQRNGPSLFLLTYSSHPPRVTTFSVVPRHFLTTLMVEKRRPLSAKAARAGWVGCNLTLGGIPEAGRLALFRDDTLLGSTDAVGLWRSAIFLRQETQADAHRWLVQVMRLIDDLRRPTFSLDEVYAHEHVLKAAHPGNRHIRPKIRQQLQRLRDAGYLEFMGRGTYRITRPASSGPTD